MTLMNSGLTMQLNGSLVVISGRVQGHVPKGPMDQYTATGSAGVITMSIKVYRQCPKYK